MKLPTGIHVFTLLRALAIIAVVVTHILSSMPGRVFTTDAWQPFYVTLDQTLRFCVPLFVALSGYALALKYQTSSLKLLPFYWRRLSKLAPLYFFWSVLFVVILTSVSVWKVSETSPNFVKLFLLGQADYHLYFVSMIFQLYLLFPVLQWLMSHQKIRGLVVIGALGVQVATFFLIAQVMKLPLWSDPKPWLMSDHHQYLLATSWIWYFVLGMWLAFEVKRLQNWKWFKWGMMAGLVLAWWWMVNSAIAGISGGGDPLFELRFTRFPLMVYVSILIYLVLIHHQVFRHIPLALAKVLSWIGVHSYLVYLSHTLVLRLFFSRRFLESGRLELIDLLAVGGVWLVAIWLSLKIKSE